ncbi:hypothetical protein MINTM020_47620 [Mycobacterium paraintracellulare]|uniref:hypothetical protein n=1 Tax=Mycobacterium avium complex (MAC) TaxID=120793 RepID=UPI001927731B|nr:hypothetical protein [Mycobacterium paraintracellulare]BCO43907.1 hypothetical protein MINTM001_50460 [Mycobacterium paraintracellulare]BCP12664.1 hypothetical protein MINTM020_47620 [Mycobacterium paraintracellulare]
MASEAWFGAELPNRPPVPNLKLSKLPTIKGKKAAHAWITGELGVALSLNHVVTAANKKLIPRRIIKGAIYFSTQDLYDWVMAVAGDAEAAS